MADKRWLNIVVDGNIALQPYWHDIVSNYLENIIRSFRGNLLEEAYLGLVLYNANTELVEDGFDMQFINWTKDANTFIEKLLSLTFKGNDANQCTMAEGLAEALVMYPKPSDVMPIADYYNGERHCILVAAGDPIPKKMMLCLPMINDNGNLVGQRLKSRTADFLDVLSEIFPLLQVSVSVIAPNSLPIFRAIFNLGNGYALSNIPISSYSNGHLSAFMSEKFQYSHNALMQQTRPSTIPRVLTINFQASNTSSLACEVSIGERIGQASRNEAESSQPKNLQEDNLVELEKLIFDQNSIINLDDMHSPTELEALKAVEAELEQALKDGLNSNSNNFNVELISSSSKGVYIPASEVQTHTSSVLEEYSTRLLQSVQRKPNLRSENYSSSSSLPQQPSQRVEQEYSTRLFQENPSSTFTGLVPQQPLPSFEQQYSTRQFHQQQPPSIVEKDSSNPMLISENPSNYGFIPPQHFPSEGTFSNTMWNSQNQFPLPHQDGSSHGLTIPMGNFPENQYQSNNHMASYGAKNTSTLGTFNPQRNFLHVPSIEDFRYYIHTWEGILTGKIHPNCTFIIETKAFRSPTTPQALISNWTNKLEILTFIPEKAVNDTKNIYNPIGYVFFHVSRYKRVNLYNYLKNSNLCGKVDLSFQSIVISPTEKENYFLGTIFDRCAVFVEQHYS